MKKIKKTIKKTVIELSFSFTALEEPSCGKKKKKKNATITETTKKSNKSFPNTLAINNQNTFGL